MRKRDVYLLERLAKCHSRHHGTHEFEDITAVILGKVNVRFQNDFYCHLFTKFVAVLKGSHSVLVDSCLV